MSKQIMTKEQYEVLKKYEKNLLLAYKSKQLSALSSHDVLELAVVFESEGYSLSCRTCGHSVLSMCAKLGELMIRYENEHKADEQNKPIEQPKKPTKKQINKVNKDGQSTKKVKKETNIPNTVS